MRMETRETCFSFQSVSVFSVLNCARICHMSN